MCSSLGCIQRDWNSFCRKNIQLTQLEPFPVNPTVEVAINWSGPNWTDPGSPPLPDSSANIDESIVRESIFTGIVGDQPVDLSNLGDPIFIPDYNPIWVSIDVRTINPGDPGVSPIVQLTGELWHEHIPEPATAVMGLLCLCTAAVIRLRRRNSQA